MVDTDYTNYGDLTVPDLEDRLDADAADYNVRVIDRLVAYEDAHQNRSTALDALEAARDAAQRDGGTLPEAFDGVMFPDESADQDNGDARPAPAPGDDTSPTPTDAGANPSASAGQQSRPSVESVVADTLRSDEFDPTAPLYPDDGRVPAPDDLPYVTVTLGTSQGVGGGGVAGLWFDANDDQQTVKRNKRIDAAIARGDLAVLAHGRDLGARPDTESNGRRR